MTHPNQPTLEDVLDMMLVAYGEPTSDAVAEYAGRFPAYRSELIEFASDWAEEEHLPTPAMLSTEQEELVFARAQSAFQNVAFELKAATAAAKAPSSLAELARRAGKTLGEVMQVAGLDHGLITKLNARRIRAETVPALVARSIAEFLGLSDAQVVSSWSGVPRALALSFHARQSPVVAHQEDFDIAVAKSTLTAEEQTRLLGTL
jgi:hypothetical protein